MSTNAISAPDWEMASVVAMNVFGTVTTTSPLPMPAAMRAKRRAIGAAGYANRILSATIGGPFFFKSFDFFAANEMSGAESFTDYCDQFFFELEMRGDQV